MDLNDSKMYSNLAIRRWLNVTNDLVLFELKYSLNYENNTIFPCTTNENIPKNNCYAILKDFDGLSYLMNFDYFIFCLIIILKEKMSNSTINRYNVTMKNSAFHLNHKDNWNIQMLCVVSRK